MSKRTWAILAAAALVVVVVVLLDRKSRQAQPISAQPGPTGNYSGDLAASFTNLAHAATNWVAKFFGDKLTGAISPGTPVTQYKPAPLNQSGVSAANPGAITPNVVTRPTTYAV